MISPVLAVHDLITWDLTQRRRGGGRPGSAEAATRARGYSAWPILVAKLDGLIACAGGASMTDAATGCTLEQLEEGVSIVELFGQLVFHCPLLAGRIGQHVCIEKMTLGIFLRHAPLVAWAEKRNLPVRQMAEHFVARGVDSIAKMGRLSDEALAAMGMASDDCVAFRAAVAGGLRAPGNGEERFRGIEERIAHLFLAVGGGQTRWL